MQFFSRSIWGSYLFACIATLGIFCVRHYWLNEYLQYQAPFTLFYLGIAASAWYGGFRSGFCATILSALIGIHFFLKSEPGSLFPVFTNADYVRTSVFVLSGTFISILCESLHRANEQNRIKSQQMIGEIAAREQSEQRTRSVIDTALDAVIISDEHGVVTEWNHQAEYILGWTRDEAVGRNMTELLIPEMHHAAHQAGMAHFLETGEGPILNKRIEVTAQRKTGELFPVELTVTAQKTPNSYYFTAFLRDITERKQAEDTLRNAQEILEQKVQERTAELARSRGFLRTIIDTVADPIFVKDHEHRWIEGNKAFWNLIGPENQMKGKTDFDLFPKDQAQKFWEGDDRVFAGELFNQEEILPKPNGEPIIIATKKVRFPLGENRMGLVGVIRDVTQQRAIEEELRHHRTHLEDMVASQTKDLVEAKERAEAANIAKTEFLTNMSHEIRTPMNAVIGLSNILAMSEPLTPKQREFLKTLQLSADALLALLNDLLDIAKIEARTMALEEVPLSVTQLVQEVISMMAVRVKEKGLVFTSTGECVQQRMFVGDPTRLRQIVLNLCSNAVKFTEKGEVNVTITCEPHKVPGMETIRIAVKDTGIGIAPHKLEDIFHKFTQADTSINRKYGGTGLGLAITKTLVEIMGGTIAVESTYGVGSTFTVAIPLKMSVTEDIHNTPAKAVHVEHTPLHKKPLVLLVEDHEHNVMVASAFLEEFGYDIVVANNGLEAVELTRTQTFNVVLMDVQMHGMNGLEATRLIRAREKMNQSPHLPIIGMTAHAMSGDRERCLGVGMDDYISKPFDPNDLQLKLAMHCTIGETE